MMRQSFKEENQDLIRKHKENSKILTVKIQDSYQNYNLEFSDSPMDIAEKIRCMLSGYWKFTPFEKDNPVPNTFISKNDDGSINISFCKKLSNNIDRSDESFVYKIDCEHIISFKLNNKNIELKLNDGPVPSIFHSVIQDMYGE